MAPTMTTTNGTVVAIEMTHQPLVARKQAWPTGYGKRRHTEQPPRHVHGFVQRTGKWRVDAMVIAWRQIHGNERAVGEIGRAPIIAQQFGNAEIPAFGLQDACRRESGRIG